MDGYGYFQNIWISTIENAKPKQIKVFVVGTSLNINQLITVNMIIPTPNPIILPGQLASKWPFRILVYFMKNNEIGTPKSAMMYGFSFGNFHRDCPCNCIKVTTCANMQRVKAYNNFILRVVCQVFTLVIHTSFRSYIIYGTKL